MPEATSFAEHITSQLDCVRTQRKRIKSKAAELEAALRLIHPEYSVDIGDDTAKDLASANLQVEFQGRPFSVYLDLIKHDDIHISDRVMELLVDRPVMCEGSPYFNAVLKNLIWRQLRKMTSLDMLASMSRKQLIDYRATVLEILAKMTTDIKGAYHLAYPITSLLMSEYVKTASSWREYVECNPLARIDRRLASTSKEHEIEVRPFVPTLKRIPVAMVFTNVGPGPITRTTFGLMNK